MLVSLDIETKRADHVTEPKEYDALVPHKAEITCVGVWREDGKHQVFRGPDLIFMLVNFLSGIEDLQLVGQNFKFDIKHLVHNGMDQDLLINAWTHDTQLMAYVMPEKIPTSWLANYEEQRQVENKKLPTGYSHRQASLHSLKTLAPYHLDVAPFWEDPTNHDNDEYVIKDVKYTFDLYHMLKFKMHEDDYNFYYEKQLPWAKELLRAELAGVSISMDTFEKLQGEAIANKETASTNINKQWAGAFKAWGKLKEEKELTRIDDMERRAVLRLKDESKIPGVIKRHDIKRAENTKKIEAPLNLNSPTQLVWLLRDYLKLDITNMDGKESTDKEVLERLAIDNEEISDLLAYRKWDKLCSTYYPSYLEFNVKGKIHTSFNTSTTRTGRLSSSFPNLQNQPKETRELFVSEPGTSFVIQDLAAIEPRLIAYFSEDEALCNLLIKEQDFHGTTAKAMFDYIDCDVNEVKGKYPRERAVAKTAGLAVIYGSGAKRVRNILYKASFTQYSDTDCRNIVKSIRALYKGAWEFKEDLDKRLGRGQTVSNFLGRPIYFADRDEIYMKGYNRLIQGSASDIVQEAILRYNNKMIGLGIDSKILITVHDELLAQAPDDKLDICKKEMIAAMIGHELPTQWGNIKLLTEGEVAKTWVK